MKEKKFNTILYIIVLVCVFAMFITTSYAYYLKVNSDKEPTVVKNFDMLVMFDKGNQINDISLKNGYQSSREFSIENFSEDTIGKYRIVLDVITPLSNIVDENFTYTLESTSDSRDTSNRIININSTPVPVITKDLGVAYITPKNKHNYKITFNLNNSVIQYPSDNIFSIKIKIVSDN